MSMPSVHTYLFGLLRPHRRKLVYFITLSLVGATLGTIAPIVLGLGFDAASQKKGLVYALGLIAAWSAMRFLQDSLADYIYCHGGKKLSVAVANDFQREFITSLLKKPLVFHFGERRQESRDLAGRLYWRLVNLVEMVIFDSLPALLATVAIIGYLAWLWWPIAVALTVMLTTYIVMTIRFVPTWSAEYNNFNDALDKTSDIGWDALTNILVVKSVAGEQYIIDRMGQETTHSDRSNTRVSQLDFVFGLRRASLFATSSLIVVALALWRFSTGDFTFGQLTTVTAYMLTIFGYFAYFNWQYRQLLEVKQNYGKAAAIMDLPEEDLARGETVTLGGAVEFRDVRFAYQADRPILKGVSFRAEPGQRLALVGASGEGKTTIMDLLGHYWETDGGEILLDGHDLKGISLGSLRSQMAYVPQDLTLFHDSLLDNVRFGRPDATDEQVHEAMRRARLDGLLARLPDGGATKVGERGLKLSGGERQRVALARAFLRDPKILVLDEPTSQLDAKTEDDIQASLAELMQGRTTFIVAHRLRTVRDADLILVIKDGVVAESGTHDELAARPDGAYRALLEAQSGVIAC
jgi:ATP-binding cassette subfamily B protein